jgi:hypothetical protein
MLMRREGRPAARAICRAPQSYTVELELPDCAGSSVAEAVDSFVRRTEGRRDWAYEVRENEEPHRSFIYEEPTGRTMQIADPLPPLTFAAGADDVHLNVLGALVGFRVALGYRDDPPIDSPQNRVEILGVDGAARAVVVRDGVCVPISAGRWCSVASRRSASWVRPSGLSSL